MQEMGHIIGAESVGGKSFGEDSGDLLRAISTEQREQFLKLAEECAVGVAQAAQIGFQRFLRTDPREESAQALLRLRAAGGRTLGEQLGVKAFTAKRLAAPPAAEIADDFHALPVIEGDGRSVGLGHQVLSDRAGRSVVTVGVKMPAQVLVDKDFGGVAVIGGQSWQRP